MLLLDFAGISPALTRRRRGRWARRHAALAGQPVAALPPPWGPALAGLPAERPSPRCACPPATPTGRRRRASSTRASSGASWCWKS
ncbi:MAG: hypothetical protein WKG07_38725 [Hymenobacter sp.]